MRPEDLEDDLETFIRRMKPEERIEIIRAQLQVTARDRDRLRRENELLRDEVKRLRKRRRLIDAIASRWNNRHDTSEK